jgi:serine/threonine protein kinase
MWLFRSNRYSGKKIGRYTIKTPVGEGRYGLCFHAKSDEGQDVIIKKFKPGIFKKNSENNVYEAVILSKLKDERIPELLGVVNEKGFYGFVLEYKNGNTLKDMLFKHNRKFSPEEFFNIGIKLIRIVRYLHENGVVHRDIRIPNVLVDGGEVYLIDFGLARWGDEDQYPYNMDFSYLGDLLLYILYSSFHAKEKNKKSPWYEELTLKVEQKLFLKRLLGIEIVYENIYEIETDFVEAFR